MVEATSKVIWPGSRNARRKEHIDDTPHFEHVGKPLQAAKECHVCLVRHKAMGKSQPGEHGSGPHRLSAMNGALNALGAGLIEDVSELRHLTYLAIHRICDAVLTEKRHSFSISDTELSLSASLGTNRGRSGFSSSPEKRRNMCVNVSGPRSKNWKNGTLAG